MSTEKPEAFSVLLDRHSDVAPALSGSPQDVATYLLSPERAQRFELLMLLISNLGKVLVVSGPDGIGKSTFLGLLKQRAFESWRVVRVAGDGRLRHGDILTQIAEQLAMASVSEHALADYLGQLGRHKNLLVLLLDDAGKVAPGVLSALWQFASQYPAFRLVLALRPDEAHLKIATDESVLGDCHYIDIPALTAPGASPTSSV
ncbi:AAA family ATPase [Methylogaea oryzae]|uniref:AAA family ATPase n=1 Tax=Methylogaea oryzae TaxID=1295382 RepID=UPI0006D08D36|nr:AAA family ATPase [Methylogaea oryzae]